MSAGAAPQNDRWVKQVFLASSPVVITDLSTTTAEFSQILQGNAQSVFRGIPSSGRISFFRAGSEDIGEPNTNLLKQAAFDYPFDVASIGFQVSFPRCIVDGSDLKNADGTAITDPLAARRLASRYTRFFELFVNNTMLNFWVTEDIIAQVPLEWAGSGPMVWTEGLSISSGELETYLVGEAVISPSVAAFSARVGFMGKNDTWNLMTEGDQRDGQGRPIRKGVRIVEQMGFRFYTQTDPTVVSTLNDLVFAATGAGTGGGPNRLYEDRKVGIQLTGLLFGDRTIQANYGAT